MAKIKAFIVPTTHWDREWVMTRGQYQIRLGHMLDKALDLAEKYPEYRFMLDGQSVVLEDYLAVCPESRDRLSAALQSGAITAGPWYVLADQELESYESAVRNLHYGMEAVRALGGRPMMEGYVPDSFGCMAALPQLLNGFGIETANFSRGNPGLEKTECLWNAPDGSKVACAAHGYGNGMFLSYPDIWIDIFSKSGRKLDPEQTMKTFMEQAEEQLAHAAAPVLYFSVGLDHMEPREELIGMVEYIRTHQDKYELLYGTAEDYMREVARHVLPPYEGEFRGAMEKKCVDASFNGTLTSRMNIKLSNLACERILLYVLEPVWVCVSQLGLGRYPKGALDRLWKTVIACHPHDSICGCSLDEVHADMLARLRDVQMTGAYLRDEGIRLLANALEPGGPEGAVPVFVFKGGGVEGSCLIDQIIRIPRRFRHEAYRLTDASGREIPCRVQWICDKNKDLESVYMTRELIAQVLSKSAPEDRADDQVFSVVRLTFTAEDMPAAGWKCYYLLPGRQAAGGMTCGENILRNEFVEVVLQPDGTFDMVDLASGKHFPGLNRLVDRLETGDGYAHHEPEDPQELCGQCTGWTKTVCDAVESRAETEICIGDRLKATLRVSVWRGCPEVHVGLRILNLQGGHCLRAQFPADGETIACDHGVRITRPPYRNGEWLEHPFTDYVQFGELTLFQGTVTAYEGDYIELLRCTQHVGSAAGADHPAPEGAMIGELCHEYALRAKCEAPMAASVQYHAKCVAEAGTAGEAGHLPHSNALFQVRGAQDMPVVSLKQAWDGTGTVARAFNMGEAAQVQVRGSLVQGTQVRCCQLSEQEEACVEADSIAVARFAPLTLRL